jgi:hypothetical protein
MNVEHSLSADASPHNRRSAFAAWLKKRRWFVIFVILPSFFAAVYYGLFASDIYVSEARFVIKSPDQKRPQISSGKYHSNDRAFCRAGADERGPRLRPFAQCASVAGTRCGHPQTLFLAECRSLLPLSTALDARHI